MTLESVRPVFSGISSGSFLCGSLVMEREAHRANAYLPKAFIQSYQVDFALNSVKNVFTNIKIPKGVSWVCFGVPFVVSFLKSRDIQNARIRSVVDVCYASSGRLAVVVSLVTMVVSLYFGSLAYATATLLSFGASALSYNRMLSKGTSNKLALTILLIGKLSTLIFADDLSRLFLFIELALFAAQKLSLGIHSNQFIPSAPTTFTDLDQILNMDLSINRTHIHYDWAKDVPNPPCTFNLQEEFLKVIPAPDAIQRCFKSFKIACKSGDEVNVYKNRFAVNAQVLEAPAFASKRNYLLGKLSKENDKMRTLFMLRIVTSGEPVECFHKLQEDYEKYVAADEKLPLIVRIFAEMQLLRRRVATNLYPEARNFAILKTPEHFMELMGQELGFPRYSPQPADLNMLIMSKSISGMFWDDFNFKKINEKAANAFRKMEQQFKQWWSAWVTRQEEGARKDAFTEGLKDNQIGGGSLVNPYSMQTVLLEMGIYRKT